MKTSFGILMHRSRYDNEKDCFFTVHRCWTDEVEILFFLGIVERNDVMYIFETKLNAFGNLSFFYLTEVVKNPIRVLDWISRARNTVGTHGDN